MPTFDFTSPEGKKYTVEGPAGATQEQAFQILQSQIGAPAQPEERGMGTELARQVGLTLRAGAKGSAGLVGLGADAIGGAMNMGLAAAGSDYRFPPTSKAIDNVLNSAGVAQPENATERVVQDIAGGMAGGAGTVAVGRAMANSAAPVVQKIGQVLSTGPAMQTVSGATGGGAQGVTREMGGSGGAQAAAGLLGSVAPQVALAAGSGAVRGLLRGGEQGRQTVNKNIELFKDAADVAPSVGQATEGRIPRAIESVLAKTPGSAGVMQKAAQKKADAVAASVTKLADELSPTGNAVNAGEAITKGVQGFKDGFKVVQARLYNTLDQYIPADSPINVGKTQAKLAELNADIPGAPNLSQWFKNSKIKGIDAALEADLAQAAKGGALPYEAIKKLRTLVGNEIADNSLLSDVPRSKWTALYGALSEDLGAAAKTAGPKAEQSWQWANKYTSSQLDRLEQLSGIVGKDAPEKVFSAAMSGTSEGNTVLKRVVDAIPKENRKELASAVLRRMGKATAGNQNDVGDAFSTETFLTNLNKLSPDSRNTLFGRLGVPDTENKLLQLAGVASNVRDGSRVFANPSGTQPALSAQLAGGAIAGAVLSWNLPLAAGAAGTMGGANLLARRMNNPEFVKWLGQKNELSPTITAAEVNALSQLRNR